MAISTKGDKYLGKRSKPVIASEGMEITPVSEMNYSQRNEYISEKYVDEVSDASMYFMISGTGFDYDLSGKDKNAKNELLAYYQQQADYNEESLDSNTNYKVVDWEIVRKDVDPESGEIYEEELEEVSADNTYNFGYRGLIDLNWRVYYDSVYEKYFYVIHPHMGGDIRGNYGNSFILEGDDKEELFYRFYEEYVSGFASIFIKLKDGSELYFDSQNDSDVFYFEFNEYQSEIKSDLAQHLVDDFDSFESWQGDEFLEEIVSLSIKQDDDTKQFYGGGSVDDAPSIYVQILGTSLSTSGKWIDLDGMESGAEVMDAIQDFIFEFNQTHGLDAEEYEIRDMEGFGNRHYDIEYMSESDFDDLLQAYSDFQDSDFPAELISEYADDNRMDLVDAIRSMSDNYYGAYREKRDFAEQMIDEGIYTPSLSEVYIGDTDKRLIAGEEADAQIRDMSDWEIIEKANAEDEYYKKETEIQENIDKLKEQISSLEIELDNSEGDEYDKIADIISDTESFLYEYEDELSDLEETIADEYKMTAYDELYEDVIYRLENELEDWLNEMGYENISDASFLTIDYDAVADDLSHDYTIYEVDGKYYYFMMYKGGGKVHSVGKAKDYNYYVIERKSKKIISGHDNKSEANKHKSELKSKNRSLVLDVYPRTKVEMDFDIDTTDKKSFVSVDNFKYGGKVKLRSNVKAKSDEETWKTSSDIKSKLSLARAGVDEYEKEDIHSFKKDLSRVRAKNYLKHKTFEMGGMPDLLPPDPTPEQRQIAHDKRLLTAHRSIENIKESVGGTKNWIQKQWEEADFGDGKGKAKFFNKGGYVIGDEILFNRSGEQRNGTITDVIDEDNYAVFSGSGFGVSQVLVSSDSIIGYYTAPQRKKLFGIFNEGGGVDTRQKYEVTNKNDKHYGKVGVSLHGWNLDNRGINYLTLQFPNGSVSTYGEGEIKLIYEGGGNIEQQNKSMLENDSVQIEHHSEELNKVVPKTKEVPAWVVSKTSRINSDLSDVTHYLDGNLKKKTLK